MYYLRVTTSRVRRNQRSKAEIEQKFGEGVPTGFFIYPVSQAADITAFQANLVPVRDQNQCWNKRKEIVHSFNQTYGEV